MVRDGVLVDRPQERSQVRHDRMMDDAVLLGDFNALQPAGKPLRDVLLPESLAPDAGRDEVQVLAPSVVVKDGIASIWYLSYAKAESGLTWQIGQAEMNELLLRQ